MSEPVLIQSKTELPVSQIELHGRLRPVSDAGVATIVASISELGQLTNPIVVRQLRRGGETIFRIMDGAHRLAAVKELGWNDVPVRVFECNDDQARLFEVDSNLAGAELNPLDTAVFLTVRKTVYERLHPEVKKGVAGGLARQGIATDIMSFAAVTADKFGLTERHVRRIIDAGSRLGPAEIAQLRRAPKPVTLADLQVISRIVNPVERYDVVDLLEGGKAKSAGDAVRQIARRVGGDANDQADPNKAALADLTRRWKRAPMAAKRQFVEQHWPEMGRIMRDGSADLTEVA